MLEVYNRQRQLIGILQNAFRIIEQVKINAISNLIFSLPYEDTKNNLCQPLNYIRYNNGELYRILPTTSVLDEKGYITYTCEHVLALLIDNVMFGQHVIGNIGVFTTTVLKWVLDKQDKRYDPVEKKWFLDPEKQINWVLGECDFARQFEYAWEQETILRALFSVANPFIENYIWTFDTHTFPYIINLKRLDSDINPQMYIRAKKNMLRLTKTSDPTTLCTRMYPLGEGEGVNQLNIREVNDGKSYIQSSQSYIDRYGIVERIWIDRRYTDAQSLKDAALAMLEGLQEPFEEYQIEFSILGEGQFDQPAIGKVVEIVDFKKTFITGIDYNHDEIIKSKLYVANQPRDIGSTIADMADRQRIEMAYSQGATQFVERDAQGNCDPNIPLTMKMLIPSDLKIINFVRLDVEMGPFRKPFKVTKGGGGYVTAPTGGYQFYYTGNISFSGDSGQFYGTTDNYNGYTGTFNGNTSQFTGNSGVYTGSTSSSYMRDIQVGGSTYNTIWVGYTPDTLSGNFAIGQALGFGEDIENHFHAFNPVHYHYFDLYIPGQSINHNHNMPHDHNMTHDHNIVHNHTMTHNHQINHGHSINHDHTLPDHTHQLPDHTHELDPGVEYSGNPGSFRLFINGVEKFFNIGRTLNMEISQFLVNAQKKIPRDSYYRIEILPDDAAHILMTVSLQGFIQSRGDATM